MTTSLGRVRHQTLDRAHRAVGLWEPMVGLLTQARQKQYQRKAENPTLKYRFLLALLLIAFLNPGLAQEAGEMPAELEVSLDRLAPERGLGYHISGTIPLQLPGKDDTFALKEKIRTYWRPDPVYRKCGLRATFVTLQIVGRRNYNSLILSLSFAPEVSPPPCSSDRPMEATYESTVKTRMLNSTEFTLFMEDGSNDERTMEDSLRLGKLTGKLTLHLACPVQLVAGEGAPVISVLPTDTVPWPLLFDGTRTSAELSALAARPSAVVGLTRPIKPYPPIALFQAVSKHATLQRGLCFWVKTIHVEFTPVQILLASDYPRGSCEYEVTREHEMLHYQDMQILFIRYQALVMGALRQAGFPTAERPVFVASIMEGKSQIDARLQSTLQPIYASMKQALLADADRRDTPEERAVSWSKCTNWYARSTGAPPSAAFHSYLGTETVHLVSEESASSGSKFPRQHNQLVALRSGWELPDAYHAISWAFFWLCLSNSVSGMRQMGKISIGGHMPIRGPLFPAIICGALLLAATGTAQEHHPEHTWDYGETRGPSHWGDLKPEFATCKNGHRQSPIDIGSPQKADLPPIRFDYKPSPLHIIDSGHTVMINYSPGSFMSVGGKKYALKQFHFHRPSEERINGKSYEMVVHLVHADEEGKFAVVAVLLQKGNDNPLVHELWNNLPKERKKEEFLGSVQIDVDGLLPADRGYYSFSGSLTTPPCSENVAWFVLKHPMTVSAAEIEEFSRLYQHNVRPTQPLYDRVVLESK